jgi:hypothetical protein
MSHTNYPMATLTTLTNNSPSIHHQLSFQEHPRHDVFYIQDDNNWITTITRSTKVNHPPEDTLSPPLMSIILQEHKLESARFEAQWAQLEASFIILMSMIQENKRQKNKELEIKTNDDLDDMSHDKFDVNKDINFKVKDKTNENFKVEEDDQDDHHSSPQNE